MLWEVEFHTQDAGWVRVGRAHTVRPYGVVRVGGRTLCAPTGWVRTYLPPTDWRTRERWRRASASLMSRPELSDRDLKLAEAKLHRALVRQAVHRGL